jgi:cysteine desulfurase
MNNFTKAFIFQMARRTGTKLTSRHLEILEFANEYYYKNQVGPLFSILKNKLGVERGELDRLFPNGLFSVYSWIGIPIQDPNHICKPIATVEVPDFREVYFDHNGTTYIRDEVKKILVDYYNGEFGYGNPSSSTKPGKQAYERIFDARSQIAKTLGVVSPEIIFTASGSEANNMAIKGIAFRYLGKSKHIVSCKTEHPSVLRTLAWLKELNFDITLLDVSREGIVSASAVEKAIRRDTILVSIMAINNEIGVINPIAEIGEICRQKKIPLMVDGVQAYGKTPLYPKKMGIDLLSFSGHKIYAPKGIGALYVDERLKLAPLVHGGEQEFERRAGTENVGFIMAFGKAAALMYKERDQEQLRLKKLSELFLRRLEETVPGYIINGTLTNRLPNNLNVGFPNVDSGALLLSLNQIGIYVSSGSACSSGSHEESHVIKALGVDVTKYGSIRFSFGLRTREGDIEYLFKYLPQLLDQLQQQDATDNDPRRSAVIDSN